MKQFWSRLAHYLNYYSSLIIFLSAAAIVYLACVFALGGLPSRYNRFAYLETNVKARLYHFQHWHQPPVKYSRAPVSLPILLYHGINPKTDFDQKTEGYDVSLKNFYAQMLYLKSQGYHTITTADLTNYVTGEGQLPEKPIMITFDDGEKKSYYASRVILESLGMKAVMFDIVGDSFNHAGNYYLTKAELKDMARSGTWDIQAHGYDGHVMVNVAPNQIGAFYGNKIWDKATGQLESDAAFNARITTDLTKSATELKREIGVNVNSFAYPYGDNGQNSANYPAAGSVLLAASQQQYRFGFIQWYPSRGYSQNLISPGMPTFLLKRLTIGPDWSTEKLKQTLSIGQVNHLPYHYSTLNANNFLNIWGEGVASAKGLLLRSTNQSSGAGVMLDGTGGWQNFRLSATLKDNNNANVRMALKYVDTDNYLDCSFNNNSMSVAYNQGGKEHILKSVPTKLTAGKGSSNQITAAISDHTVTCSANGLTASAKLPLALAFNTGNVGFMTYNPALGQSLALLADIVANQSVLK